jgi:hypothetical protein
MNNVHTLPIWKKNATTSERLYELAELAREQPEQFQKWVLVYCQDDGQAFSTRMMENEGLRTCEVFGVLEAAKLQLWENTKR